MFRKSYGPSRGPRRHGRSSHHASPHSRRENSYSKFISKVKELQKEEVYVPKHKFHDFEIDAKLKQNIINKGYENPTPIQDQSIPYILQGKDLIGLANTGTGKTAAFLIPMIHKVLKDRSQKVLIMAPTRELAQQIEDQLKIFGKFLNIWSVMCIGGASMGAMIKTF
jgi:superfamily II DNA/RNA helicase